MCFSSAPFFFPRFHLSPRGAVHLVDTLNSPTTNCFFGHSFLKPCGRLIVRLPPTAPAHTPARMLALAANRVGYSDVSNHISILFPFFAPLSRVLELSADSDHMRILVTTRLMRAVTGALLCGCDVTPPPQPMPILPVAFECSACSRRRFRDSVLYVGHPTRKVNQPSTCLVSPPQSYFAFNSFSPPNLIHTLRRTFLVSANPLRNPTTQAD